MEAKELRSGNLVMGEPFNCARVGFGDGVVALTAYGIGMIETDQKFAEHYKPIPLSSEWLTKAGFVFYEDDWLWQHEKERSPNIIPNEHGFFEDMYDVKIFTVHQLQNLYFALTGSELEFKQ